MATKYVSASFAENGASPSSVDALLNAVRSSLEHLATDPRAAQSSIRIAGPAGMLPPFDQIANALANRIPLHMPDSDLLEIHAILEGLLGGALSTSGSSSGGSGGDGDTGIASSNWGDGWHIMGGILAGLGLLAIAYWFSPLPKP